ncbi:MAG: hypothetical protein PG981_001191 [Wolbachia endosymbiont of Ctenocephalides orientis wCori]|nr:MAG: hypothetical protein PG981_001191 [Wolbachia endosymbiont of Ctenocephalides orientis wCori]
MLKIAMNKQLHHAVNNGRLDVVKYLVGKDDDVNARDNHGETPLDFAKSSGRPEKSEVVKFLSPYQHENRSRREVLNNSWMSNPIVNWVKGLIPSTEPPALLTSGEHNNNPVAASPEINTTDVVFNALLLFTAFVTNKAQSQQQPPENRLSPIAQSRISNGTDNDNGNRIIRAIIQGTEKFGNPNPYMNGRAIMQGEKSLVTLILT